MKTISLNNLNEQQGILAGKPKGTLILSRLIEQAQPSREPEPIFLDFSGVELATSSFFRTAIIGFRDYCITQGINLIPIVANANEETLEEFLVVLENKGDAIVACDIDNKGKPINARIVGVLEEKQAITLEAVLQEKETDAVSLEKKYRDVEPIRTTSWNNRLVSLVSKGILVEKKKGRLKLYRPVLEVSYGY